MASSQRPHFLVLPFPIQGHINPMLHFASLLASRGCFVTFLYNQLAQQRILHAHRRPSHDHPAQLQNLHLRFVATPQGLPPSFQATHENLADILDDMLKLRSAVEELIESSRIENNPISCIISNCLCPWAQDVAKAAGILGVMFWTSSATTLYVGHLRNSGELTDKDLDCDHLDVGGLRIDSPQLLSSIFNASRETTNRLTADLEETVAKASQIVANSFEALEAYLQLKDPMASKMMFIGPCLPMEVFEPEPSNGDTSASTDDTEYLRWLDDHAPCSVLFVSFGSLASFSRAQVGEIAIGIERSKFKFLWVVRPDATDENPLPTGFVERTQDQGRVIPWAEQLQVLEHPATGGFMTHCGWNSTLESVVMGVPMLCLPLFAEQPINSYLITKQWRVGMALEKDEEGGVKKEEVERAARSLMEGDEGRSLRKRAQAMKEAARQACKEGGSSFRALETLLTKVRNAPG